MFSRFLLISIAMSVRALAQSSTSIVCVAGQCLQGFSNITLGTKLTVPGASLSIQLLPGQYTSTTNPQLLHNFLTSSSVSYSPSAGFENSTSLPSLPLNLVLEPGLAIYSDRLYSGQAGFSQLPSTPSTNSSTPLTAGSLAISNNVWVTVSTDSKDRIVLWDAIPDISQLPTTTSSNSLSLVDMQSSACSPFCAGAGICSASGTCTCPPGFTGATCESCASGFFGPTCQQCPSDCAKCDDGISGSGRCLKPLVANAPSTCNCLNGECGSNGQCTCNAGWTTADNGTACAKCSSGFFLTSTGDCQVCQVGCTQCADGTGACISCKTGFTQDPNDKTKCNFIQGSTSSGQPCPEGSFSDGTSCNLCSSACKTCSGPTSNDCVFCATGSYLFNGNCVSANSDGVCEGSGLIADNIKHECDTCGAKCTSCKIPNFNAASTVSQLECTACLPGFVLLNGDCVESCPSGTFLSPQDNLTCTTCDPSCSTCVGSSTFCLTCVGNQLASDGKCVTTCPSNTFNSSGSCVTCHPDCASCTGPSFDQCSRCPSDRPVLSNGRCLPTCSRSQYFDATSSSCQPCDSSCSSCSGPGPSNCLACSSSNQVLRSGSCNSANCRGTSSVVTGLGVCLSDLVQVPTTTGTSSTGAIPSVTGLTNPTVVNTRRPLEWWEILLMALGCAFIFSMFLLCWRRRARRKRAKRTAMFASAKRLDHKLTWRGRLVRLGERLFGHSPSRTVLPTHTWESEEMKLRKTRVAEDARNSSDLDQFIDAYDYSKEESRYSKASSLPLLDDNHPPFKMRRKPPPSLSSTLSAHSIYSEVTGQPRHTPEPRQPIRKDFLSSRLSASTLNSSLSVRTREPERDPVATRGQTEAEAYASSVRAALVASPPLNSGAYRIRPMNTGGSSHNPFRQFT